MFNNVLLHWLLFEAIKWAFGGFLNLNLGTLSNMAVDKAIMRARIENRVSGLYVSAFSVALLLVALELFCSMKFCLPKPFSTDHNQNIFSVYFCSDSVSLFGELP